MILLLCIAYIAVSIIFTFTLRLRVIAGVIVGGLLTGAITSNPRKWLANASGPAPVRSLGGYPPSHPV